MFITALKASGYRNLNARVGLCAPLAVLVGENNAGKSNVVDALRTVLEPEIAPRGRLWLSEDDFRHDGTGTRLVDELEIEVRLEELDMAEQARMVTCLAPDEGVGVAKLRVKARLAEDGRPRGDWFGGNSQHPDVERHARDAIRFVYLHPLRDAAADLRPGRDNKLIGLMAALTPEGHPDREKIIDALEQANQALDDIDVVTAARGHVADRLKGMTGGGRFQQVSDLAFDDPKFNRIIGSLRAKIGELSALDMDQNGLGFNNLLYMAVLLAAIAGAPADEEPTLRVLLVEEPEAHLHPQLQDLLMRFLEERAQKGTQVIVTSHSPNFASSARVERLTVMTRIPGQTLTTARVPREFGLESKQLNYLRRFLDVTKAALFFARAVILVEGVAEQLLVPEIARRLKRPLAPNGVAVINVGGVAFPPFTDLFGGNRLPNRLAVLSDGDAQPDDDEDREGAQPALSPRAAGLQERTSDAVGVFLSERTLEWDLAMAGENMTVMLEALSVVKPRAGPRLSEEVTNLERSAAADRLLDKVKDDFTCLKLEDRYGGMLSPLNNDCAMVYHPPAAHIRTVRLDAATGEYPADYLRYLATGHPEQVERAEWTMRELRRYYPEVRRSEILGIYLKVAVNTVDDSRVRRNLDVQQILPGCTMTVLPKWTMCVQNARLELDYALQRSVELGTIEDAGAHERREAVRRYHLSTPRHDAHALKRGAERHAVNMGVPIEVSQPMRSALTV